MFNHLGIGGGKEENEQTLSILVQNCIFIIF